MKSSARPKIHNNTKQQSKTRAVSLAAIGYQSPNKGCLNSENAGLSYNAPTRWIEEERKMGSSDPRDGLAAVDVKASSCVCLRAYPRPDGSPILWAMAEELRVERTGYRRFIFVQPTSTKPSVAVKSESESESES